jgi:uncharacterized protein YqgC (DUF456 family)
LENTLVIHVLAAILVITGLAGLVLPVLPGAPIIFFGLLLAAWADGFAYLGVGSLIVLALLALLTYVVDFAASAFGARRFGASPRAVVGAGLGALVGVFFGLPGIVLGPFLGATAGELSARRSLEAASRAGLGATLGLVVGVALKLTLALSMLGFYVLVRFSPFA